MIPIAFNIMDLVQLALILGMLVASYWKLSTRQSLMEQRISMLETQATANESKLEKRLDAIDKKLDTMMVEMTRLKTKADG